MEERYIYIVEATNSSSVAPTYKFEVLQMLINLYLGEYVARICPSNCDEQSEEAIPSGNSSSFVAPTNLYEKDNYYIFFMVINN